MIQRNNGEINIKRAVVTALTAVGIFLWARYINT